MLAVRVWFALIALGVMLRLSTWLVIVLATLVATVCMLPADVVTPTSWARVATHAMVGATVGMMASIPVMALAWLPATTDVPSQLPTLRPWFVALAFFLFLQAGGPTLLVAGVAVAEPTLDIITFGGRVVAASLMVSLPVMLTLAVWQLTALLVSRLTSPQAGSLVAALTPVAVIVAVAASFALLAEFMTGQLRTLLAG